MYPCGCMPLLTETRRGHHILWSYRWWGSVSPLPDMCIGNWTRIIWRSRKHSQLLNHPSSSQQFLYLFYHSLFYFKMNFELASILFLEVDTVDTLWGVRGTLEFLVYLFTPSQAQLPTDRGFPNQYLFTFETVSDLCFLKLACLPWATTSLIPSRSCLSSAVCFLQNT